MSYKFSRQFPYVKKGSEPAQRVVIPKGLINSEKTTIIEIPETLQNIPTVIATFKNNNSYSNFSPAQCSTMRDSLIYPKDPNASVSLGESQYTNSMSSAEPTPRTRTVITEQYIEETPDRNLPNIMNTNRTKEESYPTTQLVDDRYLRDNGATYEGMGYQHFPTNVSGSFYKKYNIQNSNVDAPYGTENSGDFIPQVGEYEDFQPMVNSTQVEGSMPKHYPYNFEPSAGPTAKGYMSTESYHNALEYSRDQQPNLGQCLANVSSVYNQHSHDGSSADAGLKQILDELDQKELLEMHQNLKNVQSARRKLIYDASNIH